MSRTVTAGRLLRQAMTASRGNTAVALAGAIGHQAGEAFVPVAVGYAIDRGIAAGDLGQLTVWLVAIVATFVLLSSSYLVHARAAAKASTAAELALRMRVARHLLDPRGSVPSPHGAGGLATISTVDVTATSYINFASYLAASGFGGLVVAIVLLFTLSPFLGVFVTLGAVLVVAATQLLAFPLERRMVEESAYAAEAADTAADLLRGLPVLKGLSAEPAAARRFHGVSRAALRATLRSARSSALVRSTTVATTGVFVTAIALLGGGMVLRGELGIGALVASLGLAQFLVGPLMQLSETSAFVAECRAAARRVAGVLQQTPPEFSDHRLREVHGEVCLEITADAMPGTGAAEVLARADQLTGIVAAQPVVAAMSAALTGETRHEGVAARLDGVSLSAIAVEDLRRAMLVQALNSSLFPGTLADNIAAAAHDPAAVTDAVSAAAVDSVTTELPAGEDTLVGESGHLLSGGQRQRVVLARALAARAPVLVLHDPTSAVDTITEARIAERLRRLRQGTTTVLFTTSPTLLAACDRVVKVGAAGAVFGSHSDLVADPEYARLVLR
ncbi:MAG: ATP-binding cassette domain-containing protein [Pseudonocardiaceae bacterium]|nr:ATP-binding cassette domain-containing protein [Pseudonocardiaceae bacterium]